MSRVKTVGLQNVSTLRSHNICTKTLCIHEHVTTNHLSSHKNYYILKLGPSLMIG